MRKFAAVIATATLTFSLVGISSPADAARKRPVRDVNNVCQDINLGAIPCPVIPTDVNGVCRDINIGVIPCRTFVRR